MKTDEHKALLARHGLDLCEYFLACTAAYRTPLPPSRFVQTTYALSRGDPHGECTIEGLTLALDRLLARGWMVILTEADLRRESGRRASAEIPEVFDEGYRAGHVDLTLTGYLAHRAFLIDLTSPEFLQKTDRGFNLDTARSRFDVYAPTLDLCCELMREIEADCRNYTGIEGAHFTERIEPHRIGEWKPNRFVSLVEGYRGVLRYAENRGEIGRIR